MADVFVSYARADAAIAAHIVKALSAAGWSVWWDTTIVPGDMWSDTVKTEIEAAGAVVVIWTSTSISSNWVLDEAGFARDRGKLVPVAIGVDPPLGFRQIQTVRLATVRSGFTADSGDLFLKGIEQAIRRPLSPNSRLSATARLKDTLSGASIVGIRPLETFRRAADAASILFRNIWSWPAAAVRTMTGLIRRHPLISLIGIPIVAALTIETLNERCAFCTVHQIRIAPSGFIPARLRVCQGDLVAFINDTTAAADVAIVTPGFVIPPIPGGPLRVTPKTLAPKGLTINPRETYRIRLDQFAGRTYLDNRTVDIAWKGTSHSLQLIDVRCN